MRNTAAGKVGKKVFREEGSKTEGIHENEKKKRVNIKNEILKKAVQISQPPLTSEPSNQIWQMNHE